MVIKSLARKTKSFGQLIRYINDSAVGEVILHNLPAFALQGGEADLEKAFLDNARFVRPRKNGVWCYHEILSFHRADSRYLTDATLSDLAQRWLTWRAPDCLAYARVHRDTAHPHVHCIIAANTLYASKKHWLKKARFAQLKRKLEQYQLERYPQLFASQAQSLVVASTRNNEFSVKVHEPSVPQVLQEDVLSASQQHRFFRGLQSCIRIGITRWWRTGMRRCGVMGRVKSLLRYRKTYQGRSR